MIDHKARFLLLFSGLVLSGFLLTSFASFLVSRASLREEIQTSTLPLTSDTVYSEIQRDLVHPVSVSAFMANDAFLRDWVIAGEKDPGRARNYLKQIQKKYDAETVFFVSEKTGTYYHFNGILKTISADEPRDRWYFRVRDMEGDYETNVDPDMANKDTITVFVNHKVHDYDGNYLGATGVGLSTRSVVDTIKRYQTTYQRNVYFLDEQGDMVLHALSEQRAAATTQALRGISLASVGMSHAGPQHSCLNLPEEGSIHFNARWIPELDWYLVVEQAEAHMIRGIRNTLLANVGVSLAVTLLLLLLVNFILTAYRRHLDKVTADEVALRSANKAQEARIRTLSGLLHICSSCRKIRDDDAEWLPLESYVAKHSEADFSHGLCPPCAKRLYPDVVAEMAAQERERHGLG
jgi:C4-dicarboxylate-specific signal transduction histidine kinase